MIWSCVSLSVISWSSVKTAKFNIMQSVPYDSLGTLVFCYQTYVLLMGSPITGVQNAGGVGKKLFFSQSTENLCPSAVMV